MLGTNDEQNIPDKISQIRALLADEDAEVIDSDDIVAVITLVLSIIAEVREEGKENVRNELGSNLKIARDIIKELEIKLKKDVKHIKEEVQKCVENDLSDDLHFALDTLETHETAIQLLKSKFNTLKTKRGLPGKAGDKGDDGLPPEHEWSGTFLRFKQPNGEWGPYTNLQGPGGGGGDSGSFGVVKVRAGAGIRIDGDGPDITIVNLNPTPGGGGGFTELPATGSVNGANTSFDFTAVPSYIVADGVWFKPTGSNGTVFWTAAGLTITMINPPAFDIFGVA